MKILTRVYTVTVRPQMELCLPCLVPAARTNPDQLAKAKKCWTVNYHRRVEDHSCLRAADLLSLEERGEETKMSLPSHLLHFTFEAPTKNRLKRQSPNHLIKALQQKLKPPPSASNQPLEMLEDYEDWQAETPSSST